MTTLQAGSSGEEVMDLQGRLMFLGYVPGPITGYFDDALVQAVQEYQRSAGTLVTGVVDEALATHIVTYTDSYGFNMAQAAAGAYDGNFASRQLDVVAQYAEPNAAAAGTLDGGFERQPIEDHVVTGERSGFSREMANCLRDMSTRALGLAALHAAAVQRAVAAFRLEYAEPRMKDLELQLTGEDYFKYMARHFMDDGGAWVTKLLPTPLQPVWIAFSMACSRAVANAVKQSLSLEGGLKKAIERMTVDVPTGLAAAQEDLRKDLDRALVPIFERLNNNEALDPADDGWLAPFYGVSPADMDAVIEKVFGIPASGTQTEIDVFEQLVENFEELFLDRTHTKSAPPAPESGSRLFPSRETDAERFVRERDEREQQMLNDHKEMARRAAQRAAALREAALIEQKHRHQRHGG